VVGEEEFGWQNSFINPSETHSVIIGQTEDRSLSESTLGKSEAAEKSRIRVGDLHRNLRYFVAKTRGNPNGASLPFEPIPMANSFEETVEMLQLLPGEYENSVAVKEWVRQNKEHKYVLVNGDL
jgi:hypothetical protein